MTHSLGASLAVFAVLLFGGVYLVAVLDTLARRIVARDRLTWSRAFVDPVRRAASLLMQQRTRTEHPDAAAWGLAAPLLGGLGAVLMAVIPLAPATAMAHVAAGIVLFGAAAALVMVAVYLHGWSPNAMLPLLGGYRFTAQALSFEIPLVLVLIAAGLRAESLAVSDIVQSQRDLWNVVWEPLGLPIYLSAGLGLAFWGPLSTPDAQDLAGGTASEVSGAALLVWRVAQATVLLAVAAMGAAVFLGGWFGPWLPGPAWMFLKTSALLALLIAAGHCVGRVRLARFVLFAWIILMPLALVDVFLSGIFVLL